jgi:hypothetical protein
LTDNRANEISVEYRGVKYTITQGTQPNGLWRWRTVVGKPEMLRMGEESSRMQAELSVKRVIDWSLSQAERSKTEDPF